MSAEADFLKLVRAEREFKRELKELRELREKSARHVNPDKKVLEMIDAEIKRYIDTGIKMYSDV